MKITEYWIRSRVQIDKQSLDNVKTLILQGNCQEKITYLGTALASFTQLKILDLSRNQLQTIQGIEHVRTLEVLNLYYNSIDDLFEVKRLQCNANLKDLDLRLNPISRLTADYRRYLSYLLPQLRTLDCRPLRNPDSPDGTQSDNKFGHRKYANYGQNGQQRTDQLEAPFNFSQWRQALLKDSSDQLETPSYSYSNADVRKSSNVTNIIDTNIYEQSRIPEINSSSLSSAWRSNQHKDHQERLVEFHSDKDFLTPERDFHGKNGTHPHSEDTRKKRIAETKTLPKDSNPGEHLPCTPKISNIGPPVSLNAHEQTQQTPALAKKTSSEFQEKHHDLTLNEYGKIDQPFLLALKNLIRDAVSESFAKYANGCNVIGQEQKALAQAYHMETCVTSSRSETAALKFIDQSSLLPGRQSATGNPTIQSSINDLPTQTRPLVSLRPESDFDDTKRVSKNHDKLELAVGCSRFPHYNRILSNPTTVDFSGSNPTSPWMHEKSTDFPRYPFVRSSERRFTDHQIQIQSYVKDVRQSDQATLGQRHTTLKPDLYCLTGSNLLE